jgi:hypothetical protein
MYVLLTLIVAAILTAACGSAGATAGPFDIGSVWYKHPTTGDVKECGGGFYPGVQIRRYNCGKAWQEKGYTEVEKCKAVAPGILCITAEEMARAEAEEKK